MKAKLFCVFSVPNDLDTGMAVEAPRCITSDPWLALDTARAVFKGPDAPFVSSVQIVEMVPDTVYDLSNYANGAGASNSDTPNPDRPLRYIGRMEYGKEGLRESFFNGFKDLPSLKAIDDPKVWSAASPGKFRAVVFLDNDPLRVMQAGEEQDDAEAAKAIAANVPEGHASRVLDDKGNTL